MDNGLRDAVKAAGGVRALARLLGLTHPAIQHWERVPAERVIEIEALTGIARERLRPDLYRLRPKPPTTDDQS
jgi:DNA-binding transcriptional regulator YdaS (Cro superfamily)